MTSVSGSTRRKTTCRNVNVEQGSARGTGDDKSARAADVLARARVLLNNLDWAERGHQPTFRRGRVWRGIRRRQHRFGHRDSYAATTQLDRIDEDQSHAGMARRDEEGWRPGQTLGREILFARSIA